MTTRGSVEVDRPCDSFEFEFTGSNKRGAYDVRGRRLALACFTIDGEAKRAGVFGLFGGIVGDDNASRADYAGTEAAEVNIPAVPALAAPLADLTSQ